jgi:Protein of unknown function (DUF3455)
MNRIRSGTCAAAFGLALASSLCFPAHAAKVTAPAVPDGLEVPDGFVPFLEGHATGTQNYVCLPAGSGFAWKLFTPQATLFNDADREIITHFFSPAPVENAPILATWQDSKDNSSVWARLAADPSFDARFVAKDSVAWLKLETAATETGRTGGKTLTKTRFVQRVNTFGGLAPETGCAESADVGKTAFVPYMADYYFFKAAPGTDGDK